MSNPPLRRAQAPVPYGMQTPDQIKQTATLIREEQHKLFFMDKPVREAPFRLVARKRYYKKILTDYDREGQCDLCGVRVIYDAKATPPNMRKICVPCGVRCYEGGLTEIEGIVGGWKPTNENVNDEAMMRRLEATIAQNKAGDVDPKHVLPNLPKAPAIRYEDSLTTPDLEHGGFQDPSTAPELKFRK